MIELLQGFSLEIFLSVTLLILSVLGILYYIANPNIILIRGKSMLPTLKPYEIALLKQNYTLQTGKCYVFLQNDGVKAVKRLESIHVNEANGKMFLWFLGDNSDDSYDSRDYGYVWGNAILGEVVKVWGNTCGKRISDDQSIRKL